MIEFTTDPITGHRKLLNGPDGIEHGNQMTDQWIAIIMGWALGIDETNK